MVGIRLNAAVVDSRRLHNSWFFIYHSKKSYTEKKKKKDVSKQWWDTTLRQTIVGFGSPTATQGIVTDWPGWRWYSGRGRTEKYGGSISYLQQKQNTIHSFFCLDNKYYYTVYCSAEDRLAHFAKLFILNLPQLEIFDFTDADTFKRYLKEHLFQLAYL